MFRRADSSLHSSTGFFCWRETCETRAKALMEALISELEALKSEQEAIKLELEALGSNHKAYYCTSEAFPGESRALLVCREALLA